MDQAFLLLLLFAPIGMVAFAVRARRNREARAALAPPADAAPWDRNFRNGLLMAVTGLLLAPSGLYAFSLLSSRRWAPVFMLPVIVGVVLLTAGYRTWMRGVSQVPED